MGELGVLGMIVLFEWGGVGLDYILLVVVFEEIVVGDGVILIIVSV